MRFPLLKLKSLRIKILLYSISVVLVVFLAVFAIFGIQQYRDLREDITREVNSVTRENAQLIDSDNANSSIIPQVMALVQEQGMFGDRVSSSAFARKVLEEFPSLTGAYFGYEPDADGYDAAYAQATDDELGSEITEWRRQLWGADQPLATDEEIRDFRSTLSTNANTMGRFIPYWHWNPDDLSQIAITPLVDMEKSLYYQGNKNKFNDASELENIDLISYADEEIRDQRDAHDDAKERGVPGPPMPPQPGFEEVFSPISTLNPDTMPEGRSNNNESWLNLDRLMITEPYDYVGKLIFEQTYPIKDPDGDFVGIAGVDQSLDDMRSNLEAKLPPELTTAGFALISRGGRVIASTFHSESIKSSAIEQISNPDVRKAFEGIFRKTRSEGTGQDAEGKQNPLLPFEEVEDGKTVTYLYDWAEIPTGQWTLIMRVAKSEVYAPLYSTMFYLVLIFLVGLLIIVVFLSWLTKSVVQRITLAAQAAEQIAQGDLTGKIEIVGEDETGQLLGSITTMTCNLNALLGQVKKSSIVLTSTATKISANAKTQESVVNDFGSSTTEIAAAIKEITATSQELSKTMNDVTANATETANLADSGRDGLVGMEQAMDTLSEANSSISSKLAIISERAKNINQVVTTISKVADQTNLLSLNAAIEAEKAGEYGLGFSVVAREVRRLADQTAVATLDIDQMVKEMQSSVSAGVMEMDKFTEHMRQGNDTVRNISSQLGAIIEHVQELTEQFETVRQGMDTQTTGAQQINSAMIRLTEAAHSTSTSVSAFNQATSDLHNAVDNLRKEVTKFKVDQG